MNTNGITADQLVRFDSAGIQGPPMVVEAVVGGRAFCIWFDANGRSCAESFQVERLVAVETGEEP